MRTLQTLGLCAILLSGCKTYPIREGETSFKYCFADFDEINNKWKAEGNKGCVRGFYSPFNNKIYVSWSDELDDYGNPKPDFNTLGHEVYHIMQGNFHKGQIGK